MKRQDFFFGSWQRNRCYTWKAVINKYTMEQNIGGECFYALTAGPLSTVILREGKDKRWGLHMPQLSAKGPYSYSIEEKCWPRRAAACLNSRGRVPSGQRMGFSEHGAGSRELCWGCIPGICLGITWESLVEFGLYKEWWDLVRTTRNLLLWR